MMGVLRLAKVLEAGKRVFDHSFVERAEIRGTVPEGILAEEVVKVPVDELPVETVIDRRR